VAGVGSGLGSGGGGGEALEPSEALGLPVEELRRLTAADVERLMRERGVRGRTQGPVLGRSRALVAPVDVALVDTFPYVAAAGSHQLWVAEGGTSVRPAAGSGVRGQRSCDSFLDFPLADSTRFAEPAAVCGGGRELYVADAEASSVRFCDVGDGRVYANLCYDKRFEENLNVHGDSDGVGWEARFSGPRGLAVLRKRFLAMSDTLNHKIRVIYTGPELAPSAYDDSVSFTLAGGGGPGFADGGPKEARFRYPEGLAVDGGRGLLYVADAGNDAVRVVDLATNVTTTLEIDWGRGG